MKMMNQMIQFAKVQTIRDAQILEKKRLKDEKRDLERELDQLMEVERKKALELYEQQEKERCEKQREGALVIMDQIREMELRRQEADALVERERMHVLQQIEDVRKSDLQAQEDKLRKQKEMFEEVMGFNELSIQRRKEAKIKAMDEDLKLLEYARMKDREAKEKEETRAAEAAKREAELAELRAHQERLADRNEERDALRAKRATQAAERAAREKEAKEKARQDEINRTLAEARRIQQAERQLALIEQARAEKEEYDRMIGKQVQYQRMQEEKEKREFEIANLHAKELRHQIYANREKNLQARTDAREEGRIVRSQIRLAKETIAAAKAEKIAQLVKAGVPEKYRMNLIKYIPNI